MTGDDSSYYLGKGTYGVVRKCHHPTLKVVAVKCLNIQEELGSKLPPEARILLEARDDFVVQLYGICKWPFSLGLVMEFVEGGSLDLLLFDHSVSLISWQLKVRIVHQISCG
uniref:Protein kinase domain-containing protein n=1 Tax=Ciona savignyi TaxID=51511 RepID=H2ZGP2_CIOSA